MARIVDVAEIAGVAPSIVSRLLNDDPTLRVRAATRDKILAAAAASGYVPNHAARALRRTTAGAIGVAVPDVHNPVYAEMLAGVEEEARAHGQFVIIVDLAALAGDESGRRRLLHGNVLDGLLVQRDTGRTDRVLDAAAAANLPVVVLNERVRPPWSGVAADDRAGAQLAVEHLRELGHTRIAHLRAAGRNSRARDRHAGWARALPAAGTPPPGDLAAAGGATVESGHAAMTGLLERGLDATAVFVGSLLPAIGAVNAIADHGLSVPGDLSVVGFHDAPLAAYLRPALTVVRMPVREMGRQAVRLLAERIAGRPPRQEVVATPAPELVWRASTAPL